MKQTKRTAMMMAFSLALACQVAAFAAEPAAAEKIDEDSLNWEEAEAEIDKAGTDGDFIVFEDFYAIMWVPSSMEEVELTEEQEDQGYIVIFEDSVTHGACSVVLNEDETLTLEDYEEYLADEEDVESISRTYLNNLDCILYRIPDREAICAVFETDEHHICEFTFAPYTEDSSFYPTANLMLSSIQPDYEEGYEYETE